ncbi:MAG: GNAT family protein [Bacteroidota bacterium]
MLDFSKEYILEDEHVRLTPLQLSHINELLEVTKDPFIWVYFFEKGNGLENLTNYISNAVQQRKSGKEYPFAVYDKVNKQYVGTTRFYEYASEIQTIKLGHTWYGKSARGTGINKHCKYLLFQFAFETLKVERIGFGAYADNEVSIAALKSVGCTTEGFLRNKFPAINGGGRTDAILLSILKNDWFTTVKQELQQKLKTHTSI